MKGIILHGGHGTRLRPLTHTGPKQLIPVANKPISQYVLEDLRNSGVTDIAIVLGEINPEKVEEYYGDGSKFGVRVTYVFQDKPKGIAHAVGLCKKFVGNHPFIVYLGDNLLRGGIRKLTETFDDSDCDAMILLCKIKEPQRYGVAKFDKKGNLVGLVEKPKVPPSNYALAGIWIFRPAVFQMINKLKPSWRDELEITETIQLLIDGGHKVDYHFVTGWWKDTGTPEDILDANRLILDDLKPNAKGVIEDDLSIQGRVSIGTNSIVKRGALIRGPTIIGDDTILEGGVYIGPYTSVGNNVTIKRGEVENSIIMDNCLVDAEERIIDSLIGPYSKIISTGIHRPQGKRFILGERSYANL